MRFVLSRRRSTLSHVVCAWFFGAIEICCSCCFTVRFFMLLKLFYTRSRFDVRVRHFVPVFFFLLSRALALQRTFVSFPEVIQVSEYNVFYYRYALALDTMAALVASRMRVHFRHHPPCIDNGKLVMISIEQSLSSSSSRYWYSRCSEHVSLTVTNDAI